MTLATGDFDEFFRAVNAGHSPFSWQRRLLDHLLEHGRWPSHVSAPTGSGKSNVVDVHVFANALFGAGVGPRVPRRLAVVVNRRALVDNHYARARTIHHSLVAPGASSVLGAVGEGLLALRSGTSWAAGDKPPTDDLIEALVVAELRGGLQSDRGWLDDPSACAVIAATPDMWGSRLLMRGYGSRPRAWPREAGLLAYDAAVVVDEAHLNRQLVLTAARISELEATAAETLDVPRLQVVDTTATPDDTDVDGAVGVRAEDLEAGADDVLTRRLTSPKPVTLVVSPAWPGKGKVPRPHIERFVVEIEQQLAKRGEDSRPVGCIVNRVDTAIKVAEALAARGHKTDAWVGRRRPMDVDALVTEYPGLFASGEDHPDGLDVLVATQTVEVGVDLDLVSLVTELASGSALAQRAGRVNRIGRAESADIVVVVPAEDARIENYRPYSADELQDALSWIRRRTDDVNGLAPWAIQADRPPAGSLRRELLQRPELYDAWWWAQTSEDLFADVDLALFLRDDLTRDAASGGLVVRDFAAAIYVRDGDELEQTDAMSLLRATPPMARETFDVPIGRLEQLCERALEETPDFVFVARGDEIDVLGNAGDIRPGDVVIVPASFRCFRADVPVEDGTDAVRSTCWGADGVDTAPASVRSELAGMKAEDAQSAYGRSDVQVILPPNAEQLNELPWVVLQPKKIAQADTETLQATGLAGAVSLEQHQSNVEARARDLAASIGLPAALVDAVGRAALMHDEGKRDARFQQGLGKKDVVLAKSDRRNAQQVRRDWAAAALRTGWRHEQLSAAVVYAADVPSKDLVARLAGTSHGRGRSVFDHPPAELRADQLGPDVATAAEALFGASAQWERLMFTTEQTWGVWGCAYLEAVLRAADCQVSREGS